ncbi:phosphoglycerate kinase [bacterium]|nr:MAG: phosphoglycerate kinase [bacterium]
MRKMTVDDIDASNKRIVMRVDFNVPMQDGKIMDDTRIVSTLPTIEHLLSSGASLVLMSHLGRPKGKVVPELSLSPVAEALGEYLNMKVKFLPNCIGKRTKDALKNLEKHRVVLLENLRFHSEEEKNDPKFAKELSSYGDIYVNDAFSACHRAHASIVGIPQYIKPAVAGYLMANEIKFLGTLLENPPRPFVAIIGGAKVSTKIAVLKNLLPKVDKLLIGGGMAFTFLAALGLEIGDSLIEEDALKTAMEIWLISEQMGGKMMLPVDFLVAKEINNDTPVKTVEYDQIPQGWKGLDIGQGTIQLYTEEILAAKSVFLNGPMGIFEVERFAEGTRAIFESMAEIAARGNIAVVGGGDSASAAKSLGFGDKMTHISTGGGASLEFMEGKELPGIAALSDVE